MSGGGVRTVSVTIGAKVVVVVVCSQAPPARISKGPNLSPVCSSTEQEVWNPTSPASAISRTSHAPKEPGMVKISPSEIVAENPSSVVTLTTGGKVPSKAPCA